MACMYMCFCCVFFFVWSGFVFLFLLSAFLPFSSFPSRWFVQFCLLFFSLSCRSFSDFLAVIITIDVVVFFNLALARGTRSERSHSHARNPGTPRSNQRVPGPLLWAASGVAPLWSPSNLGRERKAKKINLHVITPPARPDAHGAFDKNVNWSSKGTYTGSFLVPSSRWTSWPVRLGAAENVIWWRRLGNALTGLAVLASTAGISARTHRGPEPRARSSAVEVFFWPVSGPPRRWSNALVLARENVDLCCLNCRCRYRHPSPRGYAFPGPLAGRRQVGWLVRHVRPPPLLRWMNLWSALRETGQHELGGFGRARSRSVPDRLPDNHLATAMRRNTNATYEGTPVAIRVLLPLWTRSPRNCPLPT